MVKLTKVFCFVLALALLTSVAAFAEGTGVINRQTFGTNATELPLVKEGDAPVTLKVWRGFNSTVMDGWDDCLVFQEMEKRTGVKIEFVYPPLGQETDNFNLRIASNDLPHLFSMPPVYTGGFDKAVDDGVYLAINEYYDKGMTPNYKYLRETYPQIAKDTVLDSGLMVFWPMLDYVPSSPWSGLWVREDRLKELGLEVPETVDDWTTMLRAMKEKYGSTLGYVVRDANSWYGMPTNFAFASAYDVGFNWINKEGKAAYGPAEPGYRDYLTLMNSWYAEGLLDQDFMTRTNEEYAANVTNGVYSAFGGAYGKNKKIKKKQKKIKKRKKYYKT